MRHSAFLWLGKVCLKRCAWFVDLIGFVFTDGIEMAAKKKEPHKSGKRKVAKVGGVKDTRLVKRGVSIILCPEVKKEVKESLPQSCYDSAAAIRAQKRGVPLAGKYVPQTVEAVFANLARGLTEEAAAALAGVTYLTWKDWKKQHADLPIAVARVRSINQEQLITHIENGYEKNPRLALEMLQAQFAEFSPKKHVTLHGQVAHGSFDMGDLARLASERAKKDVVVDAEVVEPDQLES